MYIIQAPDVLKTRINLPTSKSISNRALILNALCKSSKPIHNLSICDDTAVVVDALRENRKVIDVGAAGTAMRFLTAFLAGQPGDYHLTGSERMKNRPLKLLVDALRATGASIEYVEKEGFPPLQINGQTLKGGEIELDGSVSSQYISALLMMAPVMTTGLRLHLTGEIVSMPYINLTLQLMNQFGVIVFKEGHTITVLPQQYASDDEFTVESDWSAASYWYEMMALCRDMTSSVTLTGLWPDSLQGDAAIAGLFDKLGVKTSFFPLSVTLTKKQRTLDGPLICDFTSIPDMAQTVAVTCAMLHIPFRLTGLQSLKIKETDRLFALKTELRKLGFLLEIQNENTLVWNGERCNAEVSPVIETYDDHRMAMAFAPASLLFNYELRITNYDTTNGDGNVQRSTLNAQRCSGSGIRIADPHVVSKSYPSFWDDLKKANFVIMEM